MSKKGNKREESVAKDEYLEGIMDKKEIQPTNTPDTPLSASQVFTNISGECPCLQGPRCSINGDICRISICPFWYWDRNCRGRRYPPRDVL